MPATAGELIVTRLESEAVWRIPDFLRLSEEEDVYYDSRAFFNCSGAFLYPRIYPGGRSEHNSVGWIGVYLMRGDSGRPVTLSCTMGLKTVDGTNEREYRFRHVFDEKDCGHGTPGLLSRYELKNRRSRVMPSGLLTITFSLRHDDPKHREDSSLRRLQNVSANLKKVLTDGRRSDVVLKAGEREFHAHRLILESRSSVFAAMFGHDMEEERTGVVNIQDVTPDALEAVLSYLYSGEVDSLSFENVFQIYRAADKYDLKELTQLCKAFMEANLSEQRVCDVIRFADLYQEEELARDVREYFNKNVQKVVKTDGWKIFYRENQELAMDLLSTAIDQFSNGSGCSDGV